MPVMIPPDMYRRVPLHMGHAQEMSLMSQMRSNDTTAIMITPKDLIGIAREKWKTDVYKNINDETWLVPLSQSVIDVATITKTMDALGYRWTKIVVKQNKAGNTIIILKGDPTVRKASLQGTTFLATNAKLVKLGIGMRGTTNVALGGFTLGLVVSAGIEIVDYGLSDEKTMMDLVGSIGVEAVKAGLATAVGLAAGAAFTFSGVAVLPLIVAAVAVFAVGTLLNDLDNDYGVKARVIRTLKEMVRDTRNSGVDAARTMDAGVRTWVRRGY